MKCERNKIWKRVLEIVLCVLGLYFVGIAILYRQEAEDACMLLIICVGIIVCLKLKESLKGFIKGVINLCLCVGVTILVLCEICILGEHTNTGETSNMGADYILVLGNKLDGEDVSTTLKARLDCAIELSEDVHVPIIVSGGNNREDKIQEAVKMREYLLAENVQNEVIVEEKALDTKQNFEYVAELVGLDAKLIVVTSEIHMFRAKLLAEYVGFENVQGVCSETDKVMYLYYNLRETVALLREIVRMYM